MQEEIKPIYKYSSMLLVTLGITQVLLWLWLFLMQLNF
jgi:hypothetical protein